MRKMNSIYTSQIMSLRWDLYETHMRLIWDFDQSDSHLRIYIRVIWDLDGSDSRLKPWSDLYEIHMWFIWDLEGSDYRGTITWLKDESRKVNSRIIIVGICPRGKVNDISQYHSHTPSSQGWEMKRHVLWSSSSISKIVFRWIRSKESIQSWKWLP